MRIDQMEVAPLVKVSAQNWQKSGEDG